MKKLLSFIALTTLLVSASSSVWAADGDLSTVEGDVVYTTHVQNIGWQEAVADGDMSGTEGKGLRLEGIEIKSGIEGVGVKYSTHIENIGWQAAVTDNKLSGTEGKGLRLEAITIELTGINAGNYDIYYRVHAQNVGWMGWASNGAQAGTAGYGYRLEGIEIEIVEKEDPAPGSTNNAFIDATNIWQTLYPEKIKALTADLAEGDSLQYSVLDLDGGSVPELVISTYSPDRNDIGICDFYTVSSDKTNVISIINPYTIYNGTASAGGLRAGLSTPNNSVGFYSIVIYSSSRDVNIIDYKVQNNQIVQAGTDVRELGSDAMNAFNARVTALTWYESDDFDFFD